LKLSHLFSQYLYTHKELKLTGIGTFIIDSSYIHEPETGKNQKYATTPDINFEFNPLTKEDQNLILWISSQTGKMKSLIAADLDSHLELARQFLNIGKPFLFEGIGTLTKTKSGKIEFVSGNMLSQKIKENSYRDDDLTSTTEESFSNYEEMFSPKKPGTPFQKKFTIFFVIAAGLALAVWGGYAVYKNTSSNKPESVAQEPPVVATDTTSYKKDSNIQVTTASPGPGTYRFVIEESPKTRALFRFNQLKSFGLDIKIATTDSLQFKLFFILPATSSDTLRIRDSLTTWYVNPSYMKGGKTRVE
jgi:hypothetical protein